MAKATLTLPGGAVVNLEGTPEEVRRLLELYSGQASAPAAETPRKRRGARVLRKVKRSASAQQPDGPDLNEIVNLVKNCDEAEAIEKNILDRASAVDRVLLPLYVVHEHQANRLGLTSGEISRITTELCYCTKVF